ncbi:MAG: hypothetical protein LC624_04160 [Halobacteriales archaeon]|nr:hypothetical protein [Halobacteriales archaeon]
MDRVRWQGKVLAMLSIRSARVRIEPATRTVHLDASVTDGDVLGFFEDIPEEQRGELALRALKVGCLALRDARVAAKADHVEKEFERMRRAFGAELERYFGPQGEVQRSLAAHLGEQGVMDRKLQGFFGEGGRFEAVFDEFLGAEGQLQRSMERNLGEDGAFQRTMEQFLGERGTLRQALDHEFGPEAGRLYRILDPEDARTPLGQLKRDLEARFDPQREGSALWELKRDLRAELQQLRLDLGVQAAVREEHEHGHAKGLDFEEQVLGLLDGIAAPHGDRVEHVGKDKGPLGDVGDLLVHLDPDAAQGQRIVVECKDKDVTLSGKRSLPKELDEARQNRAAHFAIAVVEQEHAAPFAPLRYIAPDKILVALDKEQPDPLALQVAYMLARALVVARAGRREARLDAEHVLGRLDAIARHLEAVQAMKTNLTGAAKNIDAVRGMLDDLKLRVLDDVHELGRALRAAQA